MLEIHCCDIPRLLGAVTLAVRLGLHAQLEPVGRHVARLGVHHSTAGLERTVESQQRTGRSLVGRVHHGAASLLGALLQRQLLAKHLDRRALWREKEVWAG